MAIHQHDPNASQLWQYFNAVLIWLNATFYVSKRKKIMNGVDWGELYERFHKEVLDRDKLDKEIEKLVIDSEVENTRGI